MPNLRTISAVWLAFALASFAEPAMGAECRAAKAIQTRIEAHPGAEVYGEAGAWFGARREYGCAADAFRKALRYQPASAKLMYMEGLNLYLSGDKEEAVKALRASSNADPRAAAAHLLLGAVLGETGETAEARREWNVALGIDPHSEAALDGLSRSFIAEGDYPAAISLLRGGPKSEQLTLDLALAYGKAGMLEDAASVLRDRLRGVPASLPLTSALATVLVQQAHYEEAATLAGTYVGQHPRDEEAQRLFLRLLVLNKDAEQGRPLGKKLLLRSPHDPEYLYLNGILERTAGEYPAARTHLEEAVQLDPAQPSYHYNLGLVLAQMHDAAGARDQIERALSLGAQEPEAHFALAGALRALGETTQAAQQMRLYGEALKKQADLRLSASKAAQADQEMASGAADKAAALYREALAASPNDAQLAYKLSTALDRIGDVAGEKAALEQAVAIDPGLAIAQNQLGYLASQGGDISGAEKHFRLAVEAAPGYTQAWVSLAATLGMESRTPEAREAVARALTLDPRSAEALQLSKALNPASPAQ